MRRRPEMNRTLWIAIKSQQETKTGDPAFKKTTVLFSEIPHFSMGFARITFPFFRLDICGQCFNEVYKSL